MSQKETQARPAADAQTRPRRAPPPLAQPNALVPSGAVVWVRISPSQVMSTVVVALLTAAVVCGAFFVLWQVRAFVSWLVIALFVAAVLNPVVNWLQRRHRFVKLPLALVLTYVGLVVALLFMVGLLLPLLVDQINSLINFAAAVASAPEGPTQYLKGLAQQHHLGWAFERFSEQLGDVRSRMGVAASNLLLSTRDIVVSAAGFVTALGTLLTLAFLLILGSERYIDAGVGPFAEGHRPFLRGILARSAGAVTGYVTGYVTGNLAISVICGVTTFVVLLVLGMPYAAALVLLVAVLDLIPLVGAALGGALLVIVGFFVAPWKVVVMLIYIVVYQQVEDNLLQPLLYSHAVQLNALVIFNAVLVGGLLAGILGALLAIPVAQIIRIVVTEVVAYRHAKHGANESESTVWRPRVGP